MHTGRGGISSRRLIQMIMNLSKRRLEPRAIIIARHGKVFLEGAWEPYSLDKPHPLFSFTKSLTSTAIGFAWQEGDSPA
jgi:CubicO group peptidase (beta-lactamase class C family)